MSAGNKFLVGVWDDDDKLLHNVPTIRKQGVEIHEVYSPFPIHGLDDAIGNDRSKIDRAAFMFGTLGAMCGFSMILFMLTIDWPQNFGGKSSFPLFDFVPITFECTVLFTAFGMVATFFIISGLYPKVNTFMFDPRATDDKFVMAIDLAHNKLSTEEITSILKENGASEVSEKELENN